MKRSKEAGKESKDAKGSSKEKAKKSSAPANGRQPESPYGMLRYAARFLFVLAAIYISSRSARTESTHLAASDTYRLRRMNVSCSKDYEKFPGCSPQACGRVVMDKFVRDEEIEGLIEIAERGMSHGGSDGGATILDLHSGAVSRGKEFINVYKATKGAIFTKEDFALYKTIKNRVKKAVELEFKVPAKKLYLTHPTFFSRMTDRPAATSHDEYWHPHIDRTTYPSFYYTSLLYLATKQQDFDGGDFVFLDKSANHTVEPRAGRLSFFTSGSENVHRVTPVTQGTRYAITISFTCDKNFAIKDPSG
ncbi:2-oxoglutarate and iron-dependent oxygenase domain-containing protein 3-like [Sycon ciliatum]|uniref:2-oxoglutarate and iron-dependent oxygenase domain-containing protein 3-like n=1 Tax=Sycon ciliatum TaxID=27933 RepID=UPI0031F65524